MRLRAQDSNCEVMIDHLLKIESELSKDQRSNIKYSNGPPWLIEEKVLKLIRITV